jgi:hypothetical protein
MTRSFEGIFSKYLPVSLLNRAEDRRICRETQAKGNTVHLAFDRRFLATDSTDGRIQSSICCAHPLNPLNPWLKILGLSEQC